MAGTPEPPFEIVISAPLDGLVAACEMHCVAACCGLDAFDVSADNMLSWMRTQ